MRRIIAALETSLDGFIAGPNGEQDWAMAEDEETWREIFEMLGSVDTCILGRVTRVRTVLASGARESRRHFALDWQAGYEKWNHLRALGRQDAPYRCALHNSFISHLAAGSVLSVCAESGCHSAKSVDLSRLRRGGSAVDRLGAARHRSTEKAGSGFS